MEIMTLSQLAQVTDLAPPTVRRYLDDYILYVPSVRVDGTVGFPPEAIPAIKMTHGLTEAGFSHSEIVTQLEATYPITVISAQPLGEGETLPPLVPTLAALLQGVDGRYRELHEMVMALGETLGRLSTVIAHEIRNPLMIIKGALRQVTREGTSSEDVRDAASDIHGEIERLNRVVNEVLDFARPKRVGGPPNVLPFPVHHPRHRRPRPARHHHHAAGRDPHTRVHAGRHRRDRQGGEARRRPCGRRRHHPW